MAFDYSTGAGRVPQWLNEVVYRAPSKQPLTVIKSEHPVAQFEASIRHADASFINALCRPLFKEAPETRGHSYWDRKPPGRLPAAANFNGFGTVY